MDNIDATLVLTDYNEVSDINTCKLHLKCIDNENELYYLKFGTNKIGRSPENDICIPNSAFVSTFHAIIDVEGTNDNYLCFISDLKSTNKTKIGASLDPKSLFTLTPQKNYQIKLNDVIILGQYKCTLSFQKNKGGDTPKIKSGGTQKLKDDNIGIIKENKKVEKDDEEDDQDIDDEIEKLLSTKNDNNNKNNGEDDLEDILSEHESTHLSAEAENVIITLEKKENVVIKEKKKDIVAISNKESEDTILYSGDCNLEEASPSFFDKLKADDEMKDDDFDSDLDFDEDIFNEEPTVSNKKNNGIPKPNMEDQSRRSPGRKNVEKMDKKDVEDDSSETALSDDSLLEKEIIKEITPKRDLFNMKKIKNNKGSDGSDDDDEKREHTSPFTIPISSASPFTSSPQKKKKDNLVDLDDSASNTLSLTPIKNNSPQPVVETRLFLGEGDTGESATLPMDVPSPSSGSSNPSGKRKNENSGSIGNKGDSSPFSPKKAKPNKKVDPFDEDGTPSHSPLVKFDSPRSKSVSPHKPKKGFSSNNLNGKDNRGSPKPGGIKTKDLSMLFSASGSLDAPTEGDSLVKITQSSNKIKKDKSKEEVIKKSRAERGIDIDEGSHEMTELSEMDDSDGTKNLPQKENSSNEKNKDKKEDFVEEKYTNENNSSNFISSNKQSLFNSFSSKHNDSPGDLSPYQEDYLDDVFGDVVAPNKLEAKGFESDNNIVLSKSANLENNISDNKKKVEKELERKNSKKKTPVSSPIITPKTKKKSASPKPQKKRKNSKKEKEKSPEHDSFLDFISSRKHSDKNDSPYKVMFTGITDKKREEVIKKLGGQIVDNFEKGCSHLITNKIRLTNKFLCGISLTDHIVDIKWVDECKKQGKFVSEEDFVLNDKENEGKWKFSLKESIDKSKHHKKLLAELSIYATPNLLSANSFISEMVHAHGGTFLENPPKNYDKTIIVLSSKEDLQSNEFLSLSRINFKIYSLEFFLISVLKQELLFKNYSPLNL